MGKTHKDRAKWERKNFDRQWRERKGNVPRFDDRAWRGQSNPRPVQTANTVQQ